MVNKGLGNLRVLSHKEPKYTSVMVIMSNTLNYHKMVRYISYMKVCTFVPEVAL